VDGLEDAVLCERFLSDSEGLWGGGTLEGSADIVRRKKEGRREGQKV
jgi:hypothetical protein